MDDIRMQAAQMHEYDLDVRDTLVDTVVMLQQQIKALKDENAWLRRTSTYEAE